MQTYVNYRWIQLNCLIFIALYQRFLSKNPFHLVFDKNMKHLSFAFERNICVCVHTRSSFNCTICSWSINQIKLTESHIISNLYWVTCTHFPGVKQFVTGVCIWKVKRNIIIIFRQLFYNSYLPLAVVDRELDY